MKKLSNTALKLLTEIEEQGSASKMITTYKINGEPKNHKRFYRAMWELNEAKLVDVIERFCRQTKSNSRYYEPKTMVDVYRVTLGTGLHTFEN